MSILQAVTGWLVGVLVIGSLGDCWFVVLLFMRRQADRVDWVLGLGGSILFENWCGLQEVPHSACQSFILVGFRAP